jgi:Aspartyl protease
LPVFVSLAAIHFPVLQAQPRCPGDAAGVAPRFVQRALVVIPVKINQAGPFDFMVDTGSQLTVIDPSLATQLQLKPQATVGLVSVADYVRASVAVPDSLEADSHVVSKPLAIIQDLGQIRAADPRIRGVLGENFLAHFDLLIDYRERLLCLDDTTAMGNHLRGERILLIPPQHPESELPFTERLVISVHLSDTGNRPILLQLDSGSDGPILYPNRKEKALPSLARANLQAGAVSNAQRAFAVLPPQDLRIGSRTLRNISFVTPIGVGRNVPGREEEGLLPTVLFERVYISYANHHAVFDPR